MFLYVLYVFIWAYWLFFILKNPIISKLKFLLNLLGRFCKCVVLLYINIKYHSSCRNAQHQVQTCYKLQYMVQLKWNYARNIYGKIQNTTDKIKASAPPPVWRRDTLKMYPFGTFAVNNYINLEKNMHWFLYFYIKIRMFTHKKVDLSTTV